MKLYQSAVVSTALCAGMVAGCGGGDDDFCDAATGEDISLFSSVDPNDPNSLNEAADRLDELAGDAPDDVKGDLEVARDAFRQLAEADGDPEALAEIDAAALTEAGTNIQTWEEENC